MKWLDIMFGAHYFDFLQSRRDQANRDADYASKLFDEEQKQREKQVKDIREYVRLTKKLNKK